MTPEQAHQRLKALDKERDELLKVIEAKPTPEQRFLELIQGLEIKLDADYPDSIYFFKQDTYFVELDFKNKIIWFRYLGFWSVFEKEYGLDYDEIQQLLKNLLEKHFKLVEFISCLQDWPAMEILKKHFKLVEFKSQGIQTV